MLAPCLYEPGQVAISQEQIQFQPFFSVLQLPAYLLLLTLLLVLPGAAAVAVIAAAHSALMDRVCNQLQQLQPLDARVLAALREFHNGFVPPEALTSRLAPVGVAPVKWIDIDGRPVAIGAGEGKGLGGTSSPGEVLVVSD